MNAIKMPGFTAEKSIGNTSRHYHTIALFGGASEIVHPAAIVTVVIQGGFGTTLICDYDTDISTVVPISCEFFS